MRSCLMVQGGSARASSSGYGKRWLQRALPSLIMAGFFYALGSLGESERPVFSYNLVFWAMNSPSIAEICLEPASGTGLIGASPGCRVGLSFLCKNSALAICQH